jgi:hypothetical protein
VTLSSSKAEYVAISEEAKEIKFIYYLLREVKIEVDLSITLKTENVGAVSSGIRTRHTYTLSLNQREFGRRNYQYQICQTVPIFSRKKVSKEIHDKHMTKFLGEHAEDYKHLTLLYREAAVGDKSI